MPSASIMFHMPEDAELLDKIVEAIEENDGSCDGAHHSHDGEFRYLHRTDSGVVTYAEYEDTDHPVNSLDPLLRILKEAKLPFFAVSDAFEEMSRRDRWDGTVKVFVDGQVDQSSNFAWSNGDPALDVRTLREVGIKDDKVEALKEAFPALGTEHRFGMR